MGQTAATELSTTKPTNQSIHRFRNPCVYVAVMNAYYLLPLPPSPPQRRKKKQEINKPRLHGAQAPDGALTCELLIAQVAPTRRHGREGLRPTQEWHLAAGGRRVATLRVVPRAGVLVDAGGGLGRGRRVTFVGRRTSDHFAAMSDGIAHDLPRRVAINGFPCAILGHDLLGQGLAGRSGVTHQGLALFFFRGVKGGRGEREGNGGELVSYKRQHYTVGGPPLVLQRGGAWAGSTSRWFARLQFNPWLISLLADLALILQGALYGDGNRLALFTPQVVR